jgi:GT2 family glycosyltransferase
MEFPSVHVIEGDGNLYWAGGMRLGWKMAMNERDYDAYLLLNDDVLLAETFLHNLIVTHQYSLRKTGKSGIYCGTTIDERTGLRSYGGGVILKKGFIVRTKLIDPVEMPVRCHFTNANILWISRDVVKQIGIFDRRFTHAIADYDYTLTANEKEIPLWIAPGIGGVCSDDHGKIWKLSSSTLKERIAYLKSPKGLAYDEYLYYIRKHFPLFYPYSFLMLWLRTFFPVVWETLKS